MAGGGSFRPCFHRIPKAVPALAHSLSPHRRPQCPSKMMETFFIFRGCCGLKIYFPPITNLLKILIPKMMISRGGPWWGGLDLKGGDTRHGVGAL